MKSRLRKLYPGFGKNNALCTSSKNRRIVLRNAFIPVGTDFEKNFFLSGWEFGKGRRFPKTFSRDSVKSLANLSPFLLPKTEVATFPMQPPPPFFLFSPEQQILEKCDRVENCEGGGVEVRLHSISAKSFRAEKQGGRGGRNFPGTARISSLFQSPRSQLERGRKRNCILNQNICCQK